MNIAFLTGILDTLKSWLTTYVAAMLSFIPKMTYQLLSLVFAILDLLQFLVRIQQRFMNG